MALSIQYWVNYTAGQHKLLKKSEQAVEAGRVLKFLYDADSKTGNAVVQASMKDKSYKIVFVLGDSDKLLSSTCECPLALHQCHHVASALLFGYKNVTKTDVKCAWMKHPKSAPPKETKDIPTLYPQAEAEGYSALGRDVTQEDRDYLFQELTKLNRFTALHWIMAPETVDVEESCPTPIPDIKTTMEGLQLDTVEGLAAFKDAVTVTQAQIVRLAELTTGQRANPYWSQTRHLRLTASNFGPILGAIRRKRFCPSLKKDLTTQKNLGSVRAVQWGISHEDQAISDYCSLGAVVNPTGLWLHHSGVLGVSPDGIIATPPSVEVLYNGGDPHGIAPGLIEVKCPHSAKDFTVAEAQRVLKSKFFLEMTSKGLRLKPTSDHHHQIQGQLYVTGSECADLIVWTTKEMQIIRIMKDPAWAENIEKLINFYFSEFIFW